MAKFFNPHGFEVTAADALIGGRLRPGFKEILTDGESLHVNILMMDSRFTAAPKLADCRAKAFADTKAISAARYSGMPMIEAADSDNPTPPIITGQSGNAAIAAIRNARYS